MPEKLRDARVNAPTTSNRPQALARIGALRLAMALCVALLLPFAFLHGRVEPPWSAFADYVAPVLVALFAWGLLFDVLMVRVLMTDKEGRERRRYRSVMIFDLGLFGLLLLFWGRFFASLLTSG